MPEPRFLVLRLGSLGDIVHTFSAVAALREAFPASDIVWLTHPRWHLLVEAAAWHRKFEGLNRDRFPRYTARSRRFAPVVGMRRSTIRDCGSRRRCLFSEACIAELDFLPARFANSVCLCCTPSALRPKGRTSRSKTENFPCASARKGSQLHSPCACQRKKNRRCGPSCCVAGRSEERR